MSSILLFVWVLPAGAQPKTSYRDFLDARKLYDSGNAMLERGQFRKALTLFQRAAANPDQKLTAHNYAAICYMELKDEQKALEEIEEAFRHGYMLHYLIADKPLQPIRKKIEERYAVLRPQYLATIDTLLRQKLGTLVKQDESSRNAFRENEVPRKADSLLLEIAKIDSLNISGLKAITQKHGWPGFKLIGSRQTCPGENFDVSTLVIHADETDNLYFLDAALQKTEKGEASWWDAYVIMKNLCFRFADRGHNKLRHIVIDSTETLDMKKSYFQLKVLSDFLRDNPRQKVTLFAVQYNDEKLASDVYQKLLKEIRKFLTEQGIPSSTISIQNKLQAVKDDGLGRYRIGYYRE